MQAWLSHTKQWIWCQKVLPLSFFSFSSLLMYLCSMVWLNCLRTKYNEHKNILTGSLNRYLYDTTAKNTYFCMWWWLGGASVALNRGGSTGKGDICCLEWLWHRSDFCGVWRQDGLLFPQHLLSWSTSLGAVCLLVLDLCSSALKVNDILSPFLENILKKKLYIIRIGLGLC